MQFHDQILLSIAIVCLLTAAYLIDNTNMSFYSVETVELKLLLIPVVYLKCYYNRFKKWWRHCRYCPTLISNRKWKLVFSRPEVVINSTQWNGISVKFQTWNPCFWGRRIQWSYCRYCPTLTTSRKWKLAFSRPEYCVYLNWFHSCILLFIR